MIPGGPVRKARAEFAPSASALDPVRLRAKAYDVETGEAVIELAWPHRDYVVAWREMLFMAQESGWQLVLDGTELLLAIRTEIENLRPRVVA